MKKFMNFIGEGVSAKLLHDIRRAPTPAEFWRVCEEHLLHDRPMTLEPVSAEAPLDLPKSFE
jgi:hypothetical protein